MIRLVIIFLLTFLIENAQSQNLKLPSYRDKKVDLYLNKKMNYLYFRDSVYNNIIPKTENQDSLILMLNEETEIIIFFENLTGIKGIDIYAFGYSRTYDEIILQKWSEWISKNRNRLIWDYKNKTVVVRDRLYP